MTSQYLEYVLHTLDSPRPLSALKAHKASSGASHQWQTQYLVQSLDLGSKCCAKGCVVRPPKVAEQACDYALLHPPDLRAFTRARKRSDKLACRSATLGAEAQSRTWDGQITYKLSGCLGGTGH